MFVLWTILALLVLSAVVLRSRFSTQRSVVRVENRGNTEPLRSRRRRDF